ncbi:MAG: mechanosensitive ion channel [Alphaproteobacteria bacterium]|nr:mechanosensitive ion channel [Alphaproteobacteria bacterium]
MKLPDPATTLSSVNVLLVNEGLSVVAGTLILVIGWIAATWAKQLTARALAHLPLDLTLKPLIASLVRYAILIVTVILVLGQFGVQTTSLIAVLGAAGIAIGLALQGTLSNVAAGVMLLVLRPFRVGHYVQAGGQSGTVREIGLFTTLMTTRDLVYVSVPNSAIFSGTIVNYTREPLRRVTFCVPVDIVNDMDKVDAAIMAGIAADSHALETPKPWVGVEELQEYTVQMRVRCYVKSEDYWRARASLQRSVVTSVIKAGVLTAVTRQAPVVRNEPDTKWTRIKPAPEERPEPEDQPPAQAAG